MKERSRLILLMVLGTMVYFFVNFQRNAVPGPIFNELQSSLSAPARAVTALGSMFMYIYAVCQLFAGLLADRYGGMRTITVGGLLFCAGQFLFVSADSLVLLYAGRAVTGLGASVFYLSIIRELARNFSKNFSMIFGMVLIVGFSGAVAANGPFISWVNTVHSWRTPLLICAIVSSVLWAGYALLCYTVKQPDIGNVPFSPVPFWNLLKQKNNWRFMLFSGSNFGVFYVIQTMVGKKFLEDFCRMSSVSAGWVISTVCVLCALSGFSIALFMRLTGNRYRTAVRIVSGCTLSAFLILFGIVAAGIRSPWTSGLFFMLAFSTNVAPLTVSVITLMNGREKIAVAVALMNCASYVVVAVAGNLAGGVLDLFPPRLVDGIRIYPAQSYLALFGLFAFLAVLSFIAAWFTPDIHDRPETDRQ